MLQVIYVVTYIDEQRMDGFMCDPLGEIFAYTLLCQNYCPYQPTNISFTKVNSSLFRVEWYS